MRTAAEESGPQDCKFSSTVFVCEGQHKLSKVMWTVRPGEELSEAMLSCDMLFTCLTGGSAASLAGVHLVPLRPEVDQAGFCSVPMKVPLWRLDGHADLDWETSELGGYLMER